MWGGRCMARTETAIQTVQHALRPGLRHRRAPSRLQRCGPLAGSVARVLAQAGIDIDGTRPWDMRVHNPHLPGRVLAGGSLALGQAYMDGWWDCDRLDEFFYRIVRAGLGERVRSWRGRAATLRARVCNLQTPGRAFRIGQHHYDIDTDLYRWMLDQRMIYSCAYWGAGARTLDAAQEDKLALVCRKLGLQPGMRVLDIGCGWGGTARYIARQCGCQVVGITVSARQARTGQELCRGLPVEIRLQDYRDVAERFDRVLSIGMFEHVGWRNYGRFLDGVRGCLPRDGLFLLHTIGSNRSVTGSDPWISRYIFPNSMLPSARQITAAAEDRFVLEDWHSFGADYDRTLMQWFGNVAAHREHICARFGERFYRMWTYYLLSCAGAFRARAIQLWQVVLSPDGVPGGYRPLRWHHQPARAGGRA